jgi:sugar-phosphatase
MRFECDAVLFDIDGTLVDSTAAVERTWHTWADSHGFDPNVILETSHGRRSIDVVSELIAGEHVQAAVDELIAIGETDLDGVIALPGAGKALAAVRGQRWAAVTSGEARIMLPRLEAAGLTPPEVMITADDVTRGKPDPEGYTMAAHRLGVDPQRCLVVEDAPAGIAAGLASGAQVLAVTTTHETDELTRAHAVVPDLSACDFSSAGGQGIVVVTSTSSS